MEVFVFSDWRLIEGEVEERNKESFPCTFEEIVGEII